MQDLVEKVKVDYWEEDIFRNRENISLKLSKMLNDIETPYILNIDAPWGTGKTFFIERWIKDLKKENKKVVFFNAWENDYDDLFLARFFKEILKQLEVDKDDELTKATTKMLLRITMSIGSNILKKMTGVDSEKISDIISEEYSNYIDKEYNNEFIEYQKKLKEKINNKDTLYIFIDELDRCKPDYALKILEIVKHLLSIHNIIIIISSNNYELANALSVLYGEKYDSYGYLERIFNFTLKFDFNKNIDLYIKSKRSLYLPNALIKDKILGYSYNELFTKVDDILIVALSVFKLSLREIEKMLKKISTRIILEEKDRIDLYILFLEEIISLKYNKTLINSDLIKIANEFNKMINDEKANVFIRYIASAFKMYLMNIEYRKNNIISEYKMENYTKNVNMQDYLKKLNDMIFNQLEYIKIM